MISLELTIPIKLSFDDAFVRGDEPDFTRAQKPRVCSSCVSASSVLAEFPRLVMSAIIEKREMVR
jgi:hypothetical protein